MNYTGRGIPGPGSDLLLAEAGQGRLCVSVAYAPALAGRAELGPQLDEVRDFLRKPGIDGLLPLLSEPEPGHFTYDRRGGLTVREVLLAYSRLGRACGERAGLELMLQAAEVLADAQDRARRVGLGSHRDLSPWRLLIDDEGYTDIFGYGLPCLPLLDFLEERADAVPADAIRYAPPERLELQAEDALSDLFSLALVAAEMIAGEPVFPGDAEQVISALLSGEGPARIEQICSDLPDGTLDLLCICCEFDPAQRYRDIEEVIRLVKRCLRDAEGPSLKEILDEAAAVDVLVQLGSVAEPEPEAAAEPAPTPKAAPAKAAKKEPPPDDPLGPPPSLDALPADATLDDVRERAQAILARIQEIGARVQKIGQLASEESTGAPSDLASLVRRIGDASAKVDKATASAKRSAGLVELDEDAADAIITLELVSASEQQAESAIEAAREWLDELREGMVEVKQAQEQIGALAKQAHGAAEGASRQLNHAEELIGELDRAMAGAELTAPGVDPASEQAHKAILRARSASSKANDAVGQVRRASTVGDAEASLGSVKAAVDVVKKAVDEVERSVQAARKAEEAGLQAARSEVAAQAGAAEEAAEGARKALTRARKAVENVADQEAAALVKKAEPLSKKADKCASAARTESERASASPSSAEAREALVPARRAARDAADAAEQVQGLCKRAVALAGAAAQAAEALATAREAAEKALKRATSALEKATAQVDSLIADTDEIEGLDAIEAREQALASLQEARERIGGVTNRHARLLELTEPEDAEADLSPLKAASAEVVRASESAQALSERCRELAEDELREILKERRRLAALDKHSSAARKHAEQCREAVNQAWARYRGLPTEVSGSDLPSVRKQLKDAFDVIDIAEFQAGEAKSAADEAARQGDPNEAAGYAESAASFWERISEDLPEALRAIAEAEEVALAEAKAIGEARDRTAKAASEAAKAREAIREAVKLGRELAADWPKSKAVKSALDRIKQANKDLDASVTEAEYARDRAASSDTSADATEMIPVGEGAAQALSDKRKAAEAGLSDLKKAVQAAESAREEVEALRDELATLASEALAAYKHVKACQERLDKVLAQHGASGPEASKWQEALEEAVNKARAGRKRAKDASDGIKSGMPVADARTLADRARKGHASALEQRKIADEAEREGGEAAQAEARSRAEAEERRKAESREAAAADLARVQKAIQGVEEALGEVDELLADARSREAMSLRAEADSQLSKLRKLLAKAEKASESASVAEGADAVLNAALDAREAAQRATSASRDALSKLAEARTLSLAAAEQAAALADLREQVQTLAQQADAAVKMAREQLGFLDEVLDDAETEHTLSLRAEAEEAIASVRKAATKVHTAVPMVGEAESLDVAMHMLKAARRAVDSANDSAATVPKLVAEAQVRLQQEREAKERALAEARQAAAAPLETSADAERKSVGWQAECDAPLAEYVAEGPVTEAYAEVAAAVATLQALHREAVEVAEPASSAPSIGAAKAIGDKVQAAVDEVIAAATEVRKARDIFQARIEEIVARNKRFAELREERETHAAEVRDRLAKAREVYTAFENEVDEKRLDPRETSELLDQIDDVLRDAADAVHAAQSACDPVRAAEDLEGLEPAVEAAKTAADQAEEALEAFDKSLQDGRDEIQRMVEELEERERQREEAARERAAQKRARAERDSSRRGRSATGLRPAGPPRRDGRASLSSSGEEEAEQSGSRRLPRPSRAGGAAAGPPDRRLRRPGGDVTGGGRLRRPDRGAAEADGGPDRRLRRPGRSSDEDSTDDRRLRRPGGAGGRSLRRPSRSGEGAENEDRRLRRSSSSEDEGSASRRLRRPSRLDRDEPSRPRSLRRSEDSASSTESRSADRRLRRPGRSSADRDSGSGADRRLRRPGEGDPDRRLRRPGRGRGDEPEEGAASGSGDQDRDDLRSRLRERRASRMSTGSSGGSGRPEPGQRTERVPRPPGGPAGRPPLRPPTVPADDDDDDDDVPMEEISGAELLRQRVRDRSQGRVRRPEPEQAPTRPRRSVDGLMSRMNKKKSQDS